MRGSNVLIIVGLLLVAAGLVWRFAPWLVSWFGNLPGDIRYETDRTRVYIPITSMLVTSAVLTLVLNLLVRILRER